MRAVIFLLDESLPAQVLSLRGSLELVYFCLLYTSITRYHSKQIKLSKQNIDLYYMLVQLRDELLPTFTVQNNSIELDFDENTTIYADPEKLARVFSNILKNAVTYSYPDTKIIVSVENTEKHIAILFQNQGETIPAEKLSSLFDKFYRLDEARISDTGGTGLGLSLIHIWAGC